MWDNPITELSVNGLVCSDRSINDVGSMARFGCVSPSSFRPRRAGDWLEKRVLQVASFYANTCRISGIMVGQEKGSRSLLKLMSIELVMPCNHLIFCHPILFPPSVFLSIRVFKCSMDISYLDFATTVLGLPRRCFSLVQSLSRVRLFPTPWTAAPQASLSITNSRSTQTHVH